MWFFTSAILSCDRRGISKAWRYVQDHPIKFFIACCQKMINFMLLWGVLYFCFVVETIECLDTYANSTFNCGIGFTNDNVQGYLTTLRPEIRFLGIIYFSVALGAYITYYAFYKVTLCALSLSSKRAAELGMKNRKQKKVIKMKENDIKLMSRSWKLKSEDVTLDEKIGGGSYGT